MDERVGKEPQRRGIALCCDIKGRSGLSRRCCSIILDCGRGLVHGYYVEGLRSRFNGVVIQHSQGLVISIFVLGFAFGSAKGSCLLLRFWSERRLFRIQDLNVISFEVIWSYQFRQDSRIFYLVFRVVQSFMLVDDGPLVLVSVGCQQLATRG